MIVCQQHTAQVFSDARYGGLGGWFPFFWRILGHDLGSIGFDLSEAHILNGNLRE
jgi:hypothetical protein